MRKFVVAAVALGLVVTSAVASADVGGTSGKQERKRLAVERISPAEGRLIRAAGTDGSVRVLVSMPSSTKQQRVLSSLEGTGADVLTVYSAFPILFIDADAETLTALASDPRVTGMQEDVAEPATLASTIPVINADDAHALGFDGTGTAVAILDTGIDVDHPFFAGRIVSQACFSNAAGAGGQVTLCPNGTPSQTTGNAADAETAACGPGNLCAHGSHVAGIAAGDANAGTPGAPGDGVAPNAGIVAIQVFTRFNSGCAPAAAPCVLAYNSDQLLALQHVATLAATIPIVSANMSLGGGQFSSNCDADPRKAAIDALIALNIATVIAAGNNGFLNEVGAPGCISTAVTVGATTNADAVASFSNRGPLLDLFAPGVSVDSSIPDDTYANFQGTSMATPHVAGAWAVLRERFPAESVAQTLSRLQSGGVPITYSNGIGNVTTPRIDLNPGSAPPPPPPPPPPPGPTLSVTKVGSGSGTVTSSPPGINCPPDCSEQPSFTELSPSTAGDVYVLTAHPASGSVFTGWFGGCTGTSLTCTISLTSDTIVSAWFDLAPSPSPSPSPSPPPAPVPYDLHASKEGKGRVMSDTGLINCGTACEATYDEGTMVTLTAAPRSGWMLKRWRYGCSGSELTCTVEMSSNRRAKAVFVKI